MVTKRTKSVVKAAAAAKAAPVKVAVGVEKPSRASMVKKVSYKTGAICKKVKGKVSGLKKSSDREPWKKVLAVTEDFCEKVSETTADVYGKVTAIVKKSTAEMTESFKAGMTSVKPARAPKAAPSKSLKGKSKAKAPRKAGSRLGKFVKDEAAPAAVVAEPVVETVTAVSEEAPADAVIEKEIAQMTGDVKES